MICVITICALIAGSATQCDRAPGSFQLLELDEIRTATGCKAIADGIRDGSIPTPPGIRLVRRDMLPPREPQTQEAKR